MKSCYELRFSPAVIGLGIEGNKVLGDCIRVAVLYMVFSKDLICSASFLLIK